MPWNLSHTTEGLKALEKDIKKYITPENEPSLRKLICLVQDIQLIRSYTCHTCQKKSLNYNFDEMIPNFIEYCLCKIG